VHEAEKKNRYATYIPGNRKKGGEGAKVAKKKKRRESANAMRQSGAKGERGNRTIVRIKPEVGWERCAKTSHPSGGTPHATKGKWERL